MRKWLFLLLMLSSVGLCRAQQDDFTIKFMNDSLGDNGFREKVVVYDSVKDSVLINGKNYFGYTMQKVSTMLGEPDGIDTLGKDSIYYAYQISPERPLPMTQAGTIEVSYLVITFVKGKAIDVYRFTSPYMSPPNDSEEDDDGE